MSKILIVDDELGIREMLADILKDEGHTVYTADGAESARAYIAQEEFQLILLDIWMPDTDGLTLFKELISRRLLHCPVVIMSGHGTIENAVEAIHLGALTFLEKPISLQKLLSTVEHALVVGERRQSMARYQVPTPPPPPPKPAPTLPRVEKLPVLQVPGTTFELDFSRPLKELREDFEKAYLTCLMSHENCQMTKVARRAGLERTHLYRKLKMLNLEIPRPCNPLKTAATSEPAPLARFTPPTGGGKLF